MDPDATVIVQAVEADTQPDHNVTVRVRDVLEELLGGDGDVQEGPLNPGMDADYLLAQGAEAVLNGGRPVEEFVKETAQDLGIWPEQKENDNGLAFERDLALRQAKLAKASLQIVKWSLNENRPLRALDAANNELERLEEELDGLETLEEADDGN